MAQEFDLLVGYFELMSTDKHRMSEKGEDRNMREVIGDMNISQVLETIEQSS